MDPRRWYLGQSLHIFHNPGAEDRVLVVTAARAYRKRLEEEATVSGYGGPKRTSMLRWRTHNFHLLALGAIGTSRTVSREVQLTCDAPNVFTGTCGTFRTSASTHRTRNIVTYQVYKTHAYSRDTRPSAPLGGRTSTRRQQSNIHTWRTTNTLACA
jgi:hypothetical protein